MARPDQRGGCTGRSITQQRAQEVAVAASTAFKKETPPWAGRPLAHGGSFWAPERPRVKAKDLGHSPRQKAGIWGPRGIPRTSPRLDAAVRLRHSLKENRASSRPFSSFRYSFLSLMHKHAHTHSYKKHNSMWWRPVLHLSPRLPR